MTADLVDQAFTWLRHPLHLALACVALAPLTLLWRLLAYGSIRERTRMRNATESLADSDGGCTD